MYEEGSNIYVTPFNCFFSTYSSDISKNSTNNNIENTPLVNVPIKKNLIGQVTEVLDGNHFICLIHTQNGPVRIYSKLYNIFIKRNNQEAMNHLKTELMGETVIIHIHQFDRLGTALMDIYKCKTNDLEHSITEYVENSRNNDGKNKLDTIDVSADCFVFTNLQMTQFSSNIQSNGSYRRNSQSLGHTQFDNRSRTYLQGHHYKKRKFYNDNSNYTEFHHQ